MRRYFYLTIPILALLVFVTPKAHASIAFDSSVVGNPAVTTLTVTSSLTVTSNPNTALVVGVAESPTNTSTVSYNGVALTQASNVVAAATGQTIKLQTFYLLNPASGTHNVSTSLALTSNNVAIFALSFSGVSGLGNIAASSTVSNGIEGTSTVVISSAIGNMIANFYAAGSAPFSVASGQTQVAATSTAGGTARSGGAAYVAGSPTVTTVWNLASAQTFDIAGSDIELVAASTTVTAPVRRIGHGIIRPNR